MNSKKTQPLQISKLKTIHKLSPDDVYEALNTERSGLADEEAACRLEQYGKNVLQKKKGTPLLLKFLSNFTHLMAILLWVAGIVALIAKLPELAIAIWMVIIINGVFSFWQEFRAGKATEALKKMLPVNVRVLRGGQEQQLLAEDLVPGDIILLAEGDKISADARLIADNDLRVNQSTLTGESHPVHKSGDSVLRDDLTRVEQPNMVFAGTTVAAGTGKAIVCATGMSTEFGKIANLTQSLKEESSPLQKEMGKLTKRVSEIAVGIGIAIFFLAVLLADTAPVAAFIFALGMIVAFIPEGLLPTVTLSLAMGVQRMAKRNALIKRLSAVETLGCTTVICTDKTGTLTQNEMTVSNLWMNGVHMEVSGVGYDAADGSICLAGKQIPPNKPDLSELLTAASLCCNARLLPPEGDTARFTVLGDPTEAALLVLAQKYGLDLEALRSDYPRLRELPFDSGRKRMSTIYPGQGKTRMAFVKGAPKEILDLCTQQKQNGALAPMREQDRAAIMAVNDDYARNGLRVLAIASRNITPGADVPSSLGAYTPDLVEKDLTFLGLIAMVDPPRPEVAEAVKKCHHAGIRIIMITGDYGLTAESIARRIGIVKGDHPRIITGLELEKMGAGELKAALADEVIFARVAPEQKLQVVNALQEMKHIVAVTGDGVNDSPALKKADIGVAMGISGTDVAKEAADMILTDDNFASIVNAIEEGRAVYNNIRKFVLYIFNSNMAEAVPMVLYLFSGGVIPLPLTIMQVLAIDLGTDMVPAMGLGVEKPEAGIMNVPPRSQKESLLSRPLILKAFCWYGLLEAAFGTAAYFFLNNLHGWPEKPLAASGMVYQMATAMTFAAIVMAQVGAVFGCRTERLSVFKAGLLSNRLILIGIAVEFTLLGLLVYLPIPYLHNLFNTAPLGWREWAFLIGIPPVMLLLDELRKGILRRWDQVQAHHMTTERTVR
ncbi:MAG: cation-transporting P-type ATPase [Oscillospiraceae bacterium]|nr:cation-transporting P-type ATPase [Oscillospiraceae bacterium]MDD4367603.1 cation-transporting P-type ATPase [Oscillospiraceae bacterium]